MLGYAAMLQEAVEVHITNVGEMDAKGEQLLFP